MVFIRFATKRDIHTGLCALRLPYSHLAISKRMGQK